MGSVKNRWVQLVFDAIHSPPGLFVGAAPFTRTLTGESGELGVAFLEKLVFFLFPPNTLYQISNRPGDSELSLKEQYFGSDLNSTDCQLGLTWLGLALKLSCSHPSTHQIRCCRA